MAQGIYGVFSTRAPDWVIVLAYTTAVFLVLGVLVLSVTVHWSFGVLFIGYLWYLAWKEYNNG